MALRTQMPAQGLQFAQVPIVSGQGSGCRLSGSPVSGRPNHNRHSKSVLEEGAAGQGSARAWQFRELAFTRLRTFSLKADHGDVPIGFLAKTTRRTSGRPRSCILLSYKVMRFTANEP